ncbi:DUF1830 domain-containing protein [Chlorogloea sp. CCALA 695]|uniref:DUF1830 domain-containing protein n=2 Tax=Chlorogloea sp. CCALA 695 TaxID=2107693 RepID=UPI002699E2E3
MTMTQTFDLLPSQYNHRIICDYINATNFIQIVRITNITNWYFERVVFPQQHLLFKALPDAQLEIHTSEIATAMKTDKIKCESLQIHEDFATF